LVRLFGLGGQYPDSSTNFPLQHKNSIPYRILVLSIAVIINLYEDGSESRQRKELWIRIYKSASGKPSVTWADCVVEAIRYGWIDGQKKPLDDSSFLQSANAVAAGETPFWPPLGGDLETAVRVPRQ
jgi:hypothetical protein